MFFISCKNNVNEIDYCEISNSMYIEKIKENPKIIEPYVVNNIYKIDDLLIKNFLLLNSDKFKDYDFENYFENINSEINYDFNCKTIDLCTFKKEEENYLTFKKHQPSLEEAKYIQFYEVIFNFDKTEFILCYKEIRSDFKSNFRLEQYNFKDGKISYKGTLLVST
jgi:tyrosyl-tRNA synthetase